MTASIPLKIFQGVTPKPVREYLRKSLEVLRATGTYQKLVIPAAGQFMDAQAAILAGWKPDEIYASDISLYSSVIGYVLTGQDLASLNVQLLDPFLAEHIAPYLSSDLAPAAMLYAMKWAQIKAKNQYEAMFKKELETNRDNYLNDIAQTLNSMKARLGGLHYRIADAREELSLRLQDPDCIISFEPPGAAQGYTKMFDFQGKIKWAAPAIPEINSKDELPQMVSRCMKGQALAIIQAYHNIDFGKYAEHIIYTVRLSKTNTGHLITNKPDIFAKIADFKRGGIRPPKYKYLPESHTITPESKIVFVSAPKEEALYCRNLFVHKLGPVKSEKYFFGVIDSFIFAIVGLHLQDALSMRYEENFIYETFGVTVPNKKYPRITKLMMMCLGSQAFLANLETIMPVLKWREIAGIRTANLTPHPEHKILRGIWKLVKREPYKNGLFKLTYETEWKPWTYQDCIRNWMKREKING